MDFNPFSDLPIIDGHIHFSHPALTHSLTGLVQTLRYKRVNLVAITDAALANHNPALIHYKLLHPDQTFISGALDYFSALADPQQAPQALAAQVKALKTAGFDGLKLLESKPMVRKMLDIPLDGPVYAEMWANVAAMGLPTVWHVGDPEEFWDRQRCPDWAMANGWFYGDGGYPALDALYAEVEHVLTRHPDIKVILAHFFFLSEHLERAADFLEAHPNACFDLTPGSEMFFNFSKQLQKSRDFFLRYQDRLVFGSDIGASAILAIPPQADLNRDEFMGRAWVVRRFLETSGDFSLPTAMSHWARGSERLEGIQLPGEVLEKIYCGNFERLYGANPLPLNRAEALSLVERLTSAIDANAGRPIESPARQVARELHII